MKYEERITVCRLKVAGREREKRKREEEKEKRRKEKKRKYGHSDIAVI